MRTEPAFKNIDKKNAFQKERTEKVTKILALLLAFVSTFFFFFKLLYL